MDAKSPDEQEPVWSSARAGKSAAGRDRRRAPHVLLRWIVALALSAIVAAVGLMMDQHDLAIVNTLDKHVGDWRIAVASPRAADQRPDIAIVMITEDTLLDYESRSPIDRKLIAELIRAIDAAEPRAIALDLIFDRRTRDDTGLIDAMRKAKAPLVLGAIDRRVSNSPEQSFARQAEFLEAAGKPVGHIMLERKVGRLAGGSDSTVRLVADEAPPTPEPVSEPAQGEKLTRVRLPDAFVDVIAGAAGVWRRPESREISWLRPPASGHPLFLTLSVPQHDPKDVRTGLAGIVPDYWREILKGRIVLVGASMVDRDQHVTPLSVLDGPVPGVTIHAQALAQRLDGNRDVHRWPWWTTYLVVTCVALVCLLAGRARGFNPRGAVYGMIGLVAIGLASGVAYWLWRVDFPSIALTTAWLGGGLCGFSSDWLNSKLGV